MAAAASAFALLLTGTTPHDSSDEVRVRRVLDGDSVLLADGNQLRYLGINAPEAGEPFSENARALNRRLVEGKQVKLVRDRKRRDGYGRLLAYVYVRDRFVNADLLRAGLAHLMIFEPLREEQALATAQHEARTQRRGIWGSGGPTGPLRITSPRSRHRPLRRLRSITVCNISDAEIDLDGFSLQAGQHSYRFPRSRIRPGHVVLIVTTKGKDRLTGPGPQRFYWPDAPPRGTLEGVSLILRGPAGEVIDRVLLAETASRFRLRLETHPFEIFAAHGFERRVAAQEKDQTSWNR